MKLEGKVAIVTGGAQGIGKAYAMRLSEEGAKVVIADILDSKSVQQWIEDKGGEALALYTDVSKEESAEEMAHKTVERFGRIDILINNAAIFSAIVTRPFFEISAKEWDDVIRVNLKGLFLCSKAVYSQMKKQGKGKIINISSGTFFKGVPNFIHYVTSKGGVVAFTRALAREVGDAGICVNAIAPGYTTTDVLKERAIHDDVSTNLSVTSRCFKRDETPEDLTGSIVFLSSDDSDFITGQTIAVDGGSVMH
ncbi:MAG: 3-oxoacyl-ACP reductase family protein [Desulfatiglandales bacterium]|jgi:NAD(P)-dependent dehydrogenase (short-subunit alcohol dehydrogenase family)|nr:3-oxoacyl-ACP reductase family protein [Desulfatiglandales bacterium]